jgi:hypothetical protein
MNHRYGAITTATLAALVLGTAPAMAQISKGLDANVGAGANVGTGKSDANMSSPTNQAGASSQSSSSGTAQPNSGGSSYNANPSGGVSGSAGVSSTDAIAGAKKDNEDVTKPSSSDSVSGSMSGSGSTTGGVSGSGSVTTDQQASGSLKNGQSPSASPSMSDDKAISNQDDRERMKQQEQIDKKTGLDRADQAAGPHGAEGRANARTRGSQQ